MREVPLPGGSAHAVVRVGRTVRRPATPRSRFVRELLRHFERHGWPGAPRHLGSDEVGRDVPDYMDGHVAWEPVQPEAVHSDASLVRTARLVRQFHELTAGTALRLAAFLGWDPAAGAVGEVRAARRWVAAHRGGLECLLR
ncbi:hypothetical protein [Streptomyces sp. NRRL F-5755]|uniref:hypothetical protein n=1 Tax=Streptomyces sp. NRRL F-5755 TaxID=1519475 RepID=UPI000A454FB2|nr:hypothetical protein [Streptomyces sp. NRRL F-5755]